MFVFPHIKVKTVIHHLRRLPLYKRSGCEILAHRVLRETVLKKKERFKFQAKSNFKQFSFVLTVLGRMGRCKVAESSKNPGLKLDLKLFSGFKHR